ncbi:hypothetical protein DEU56DRAFT_773390 [Suillus clintonianus]|uniref:uncharacterized protein n=1 Tax=Suillus clintonianus TaxID=1904413 RepID=UPI001B87B667|nr:uncharacterized protein DEU56DRAFT_773390 [Suillus clintonianus]KAG2153155.1 hypothetical protein DEU56DRAFT_773390 [Suillus clintonianus]
MILMLSTHPRKSNNRCHFTKACIHTASRAIHVSNPLLKMSMHLHESRFTPTSLPSTSSRIGVVERCTSSTNDECLLHHGTLGRASNDQDSMKPALHSCLELLDQLCHRLNNTYKETLEIRARITEILAMGNTGALDSNVDPIFGDKSPTIAPVALNELGAIPLWSTPPNLALLSQPPVFQNSHGHPSDQGYEFLTQASVGVISTLPEYPDPAVRRRV